MGAMAGGPFCYSKGRKAAFVYILYYALVALTSLQTPYPVLCTPPPPPSFSHLTRFLVPITSNYTPVLNYQTADIHGESMASSHQSSTSVFKPAVCKVCCDFGVKCMKVYTRNCTQNQKLIFCFYYRAVL